MLVRPKPVPVVLERIGGGRGDAPLGFARDLEPPGVEELPEVLRPQIQQALATVSQASKLALAVDRPLDAEFSAPGSGQGDSRRAGPLGDGDSDGIPRHERWEIIFEKGNTLDTYAKFLDFFKIELGVLSAGNMIEYASALSSDHPKVHSKNGSEENRLFMTWRVGRLQEADRALLAKAGINSQGRSVIQFYPFETENQLALLEKARAGNRSISSIRKTFFGVRTSNNGFEFYVLRQQFR